MGRALREANGTLREMRGRLCDLLPVSDVAALEGLRKDAVYRMDKK